MFIPGFTVWYSVQNLDRSLAFYTEKLGFELLYHNPEWGMAMVKTNTENCVIGFSEAETVVPSTSSTVFDVENIDTTVHKLQQQGVAFAGEIETITDFVKLATFSDPDGHSLMLSQQLTEL
ncbi:VOC family protein [Paenibacillus hemerocallicola]|uniref:VOC family protein n=1 Tax=Paenibacillus hemerocallicola TaxID=1172614 RepID=A0A5C4T2V8_9BACL|nr:VOC family protein [Paenibacillus hemerocallicola]TNJ62607.1 VOC family protein [Paenibacillus hemerocallicola]